MNWKVRSLALIALLAAAGFAGAIVWASFERDVVSGLFSLLEQPWALVTLADLAAGLVFVAIWIAVLERGRARALLWIVPLFALGNLVTLIYLAQRAWGAPSVSAVFLPSRA